MDNIRIPSDPVFGWAEVSKLLGISKLALHARRHRKTLDLQPVTRIGRMDVFSMADVRAYAEQHGLPIRGADHE